MTSPAVGGLSLACPTGRSATGFRCPRAQFRSNASFPVSWFWGLQRHASTAAPALFCWSERPERDAKQLLDLRRCMPFFLDERRNILDHS